MHSHAQKIKNVLQVLPIKTSKRQRPPGTHPLIVIRVALLILLVARSPLLLLLVIVLALLVGRLRGVVVIATVAMLLVARIARLIRLPVTRRPRAPLLLLLRALIPVRSVVGASGRVIATTPASATPRRVVAPWIVGARVAARVIASLIACGRNKKYKN